MSQEQLPAPAVTVSMAADDIALMTMDLPGSGANILNDQLFRELDQTMAELAERKDLAGVILVSAKPSIFVAGADLNNILNHLDWPDEEIVKFCQRGRAVMARFSRCPFVSVAAIHGACVGGGLELALWCDYRVASDHRRTVLGLPEVKLGLVPGWAGTVRLPRISGLEVAADLVATGRLVSSTEAQSMKFVEAVVDQENMIEESIALIRRVQTSGAFIDSRKAIMGPVPGLPQKDDETLERHLFEVSGKASKSSIVDHENYPYAPMIVLEHMMRTSTLGIKQAWDSESLAMAQVWGTPANRGLLNHFFLTDRNKKEPGFVDLSIKPDRLEAIGIVGAGLMGATIAEHCLKAGLDVTLLDANETQANKVAGQLKKKKVKGQLHIATDYTEFAGLPFVLESVVETMDVKKIVLQQIEAVVDPATIIASNTSSIPIEKLAQHLEQKNRFCGLHFCHPQLMALAEVVCGPDTDESTIAAAVGVVKQMRKMPVAINDGPGFVVNRLLAAMLDQAIRLFNQGVDLELIDSAMQDFGFAHGPFEMIDLIGVDTCMYAGRTMWESGVNCVTLSPILPRLVKAGRLGVKTGSGFYNYRNGEAKIEAKLLELIGGYRNDEPTEKGLAADKISKRILAAMALEATSILDEDMVADPRDIDLCLIYGIGFPKHQGGLLFWADQLSWQTVKEIIYKISHEAPEMEPSDFVKDFANNRKRIYDPEFLENRA